jgi:hypothetical protein
MTAGHLLTIIFGPSAEWWFVRTFVYISVGAVVWQLRPVPRSQRALMPSGPRSHRRSQAPPKLAAALTAVAAVTVLAVAAAYGIEHVPAKVTALSAAVRLDPRPPYIGVFEPEAQNNYDVVDEFGRLTDHNPQVVLYYSNWDEPFDSGFAARAHAGDATPFVELLPQGHGVSMKSIASGSWDSYIRSYAEQIRRFRYRVIIGFAPEMNGNWYSWGYGRTPSTEYVAAWRHVVNVFRAAGATNVTWLWIVSETDSARPALSQWWPGSDYVTWAGIDGYFYSASENFKSVFGTALSEIRSITNKPVFIPETAAGPGPQQANQIKELFEAVKQYNLVGMIWFDQHQDDGKYHLDWQIEGDSKALSAFRWGISYLKRTMNSSL